jgi:hypothetical protein
MPVRRGISAPASTGAPDKINFDRLWEAALRPAIDKAGYEPVRANEDIGALIINEMIERLAISDPSWPMSPFPMAMSTTRWASATLPKGRAAL